MDTFAVGPTLIAYAKLLGGGNLTFSILNSIPYFGNLWHLFSAWLLTKGYSVRKVSVITTLISRPFYLLIALLAFLPWANCSLFLMILFLCCCYFVGCVSGGCWMPWMKALIPEDIMGVFFARRFKYMQITRIICFLGAAALLEHVHASYPQYEIYGYAFLFLLSFLSGLYGVFTLCKIEDRPVGTCTDLAFVKQISVSLKSKSFRSLLIALSILNFGFAFLVPYITVFMLNKLNIPMAKILYLTLASQISYVFVIKKLGKLNDHRGSSYVLLVSILLLVFLIFGLIGINYLHCTQNTMLVLLLILHIILGCATAAFNLGQNNASLMYISDDMSAVYLSVNSIFKSAAGALGALTSGVVLSVGVLLEEKSETFLTLFSISSWTIFFIIALCIELSGIFLLKSLQKNVILNSQEDRK